MAEPQPPNVVEGATTGDVDEEVPAVAKSAEDRKAAAALSSLDRKEDESGGKEVDQEAVKKAMARLTGTTVTNGTSTESKEKAAPKKIIKVDASDVNLLVEELELTKANATELLRAHGANVKEALSAYVTPPQAA